MKIAYKRIFFLCCIVVATGACSSPAIAQERQRTAKPRIIVGGEIDYPPFSFLNAKGEPAGFSVELTHAIARTMGFDAEIRLTVWSDARKAMEEGTVDILLGMFYSEDRSKVYDFSQPFNLISNVIFVRKNSPSIHSIEDLNDKEIIIMRGEIMHDYVVKQHVTDRFLLTETPADALRLLASGKGDCALLAQVPGLYWLRELNLSNLTIMGKPIAFYKNCFAVRKGNNLVLARFSEGLEILNQTGEYRALYEKWLSVLEPSKVTYRQIVKYAALILIPLLFLLAVLFVWAKTLRRKVREKTKELLANEEKYRNLVEQAGSIIMRWKPDGTITFVNEFAEKFFGYSRQELLGGNLLGTIIPERDSGGHDLAAMFRAVVADPERFILNDHKNIRRDGSHVLVNWSSRPVVDAAGNIIEFLSIGNDVTERRQVEQQLARSEEQYRRIVETVNEGIWSVDSAFFTTFVNRRLCEMLGYAHDDILGRRLDAFMLQEDVYVHADGCVEFMGRQTGLFERRFVRRDGSVLWALFSAMPIIDEKGCFAGSLATLTDISAQKQVIMQLQLSESKYRMLFEHMSQGCFYKSADDTLTDINPAALNMLGLARDEFLGQASHSPLWNVVDENESPLSPDEFPSMVALKTGRSVMDRVVGVFNERVQDYVWMFMSAVPQFHAGEDTPYEVFVTLYDISSHLKAQRNLVVREQQVQALLADAQRARKALLSIMEDDRQAHESLRESEERFRSVVETATDAIITVDNAGTIVVWNRAATQIFGYEYLEIIGRPFALLLPMRIQEQNVAGMLEAMQAGVLPSPLTINEAVGLNKDGTEFPVEIALGVVKHKGLSLITAIMRDISERKLIEQEALRTAQLVSIGELAAGVAHEINNPIMGVINYAQILLNKISKQGGETEIPERIIREGTRIAGIVTNLLNFSRSAAETIKAVPVSEIFDPSFQLMQKLFQQSEVVVDTRLGDDLPRVLVRGQKIQQVFINLLSNALYALNMRFPDSHADKRLEIWAEELIDIGGAFVRVIFLDHGCGISSEHLTKICSPFFSTKPTGKGTGLGLSISHTIVKEHGGRLLFESVVGEYTRVMVDLPAEMVKRDEKG